MGLRYRQGAVFMFNRGFVAATVLAMPLLLAACGGRYVQDTEYNDPRYRTLGEGTLSGSDDSIFSTAKNNSADKGGAGLGVNAYLWRASLDTLSFMPLASADPFGGVIITDWWEPPTSDGERFKATAYILGRQLRADGVRVSIFRQVRQGGQWVDAPVTQGTAGELENRVLARARELRSQSASGT